MGKWGYVEQNVGLSNVSRELLKYLEANTGDKITRLCQVDWLYDTLLIESIYNKVEDLHYIDSFDSFSVILDTSHVDQKRISWWGF